MTRRIDSLLFSSRVCLMKIDVERGEPSVLIGALNTITNHKPLILIEILNEMMHLVVHGILSSVGYQQQFILDGRNHLYVSARQ